MDVDLEDGLHEPPLGSGTQPCPLRLWLTWEDQESGGPGPGPHLRADRGTLPFLLRGLRGVGGPQVGGLGSPQRGQARKHGRRAQGGGGGPGLVGMGFRCRLTDAWAYVCQTRQRISSLLQEAKTQATLVLERLEARQE